MWSAIVVFQLLTSLGADATQVPHAYALVIGNNEPPALDGTLLPRLHYADDDAVRYHQYFSHLVDQQVLLAVLDADTQKRFGEAAAAARAPTKANLRTALAELREAIARDGSQGIETVFYFVFSGHGSTEADGTPFLALTDGGISPSLLREEVMAGIPATYTHLIVDACNAGAVVDGRGRFDKETDAQTSAITQEEAWAVVRDNGLGPFPHVGVIIATSAGEEAHEWSRLEAGVFTHELLSALSGAADVNHDDRIEYSEAAAFIAAANRDIRDPRARLRIVSAPPALWQHAPLVTLAIMRDVAWLEGSLARFRHFFIEMSSGERYLDANVDSTAPFRLALPAGTTAFLHVGQKEAELSVLRDVIPLEQLRFAQANHTERGSIGAAYEQSFFGSSFNEAYYKGFVDSTGTVTVEFPRTIDADLPSITTSADRRHPWFWGVVTAGGAALVTSGVMLGLTVDAKQDFDRTQLQRTAHEANDRFVHYRAMTVGAGLITAGFAVAAWLLKPEAETSLALSADGGTFVLALP